jgi:RND family efflux transporter, MFP subunit
MKHLILIALMMALMVSCVKKQEASLNSHIHDHENCGHDHEHDHSHDHDHGHSHSSDEHNHDPNAIIFTPEQAAKIDFAVAKPEVGPFGQVIKTTAQVQSSGADETVISAKSSGMVVFGKTFAEGQAVSSAAVLFTISGSGIDNNSMVRFTEAKANFEKAKDTYERASQLTESKIVSASEFQSIKAEYEVAQATYDNLQRNFSSQGQRVSSPMNGFIKQLMVSNGQYVEEGQALFSVSSNKTLLLKADVSPKFINELATISGATVRTADKKMYDLDDLGGKLISYGKTLSEGNYMIPVTFQVNNQAAFIPGGFVELNIRTQSSNQAMSLPNTALTEEQGLFFVYVQLCGESYEKRQVETGGTDGIKTEIISGITPNERVVVKGAMSVKLAQASGALDPHAGHVH